MSVASDEVRSLPPPLIDPADVAAILPSLSEEDAALYASLATLALQALCWPNDVPSPPPPPVQTVGLAIATRLAVAGESAAEGGGGAVVSESIGAYTYRLANPGTFDSALALSEGEKQLLRPWLGQASAYDVWTAPEFFLWPPDWWQRDYDRLEYPPGADA
jgi:hypothetical protein